MEGSKRNTVAAPSQPRPQSRMDQAASTAAGVNLAFQSRQGPQDRHGQTAGAATPLGGILRQTQDDRGDVGSVGVNIPYQQGPRDWLCQTAGAAAPSGGSAAHEVASVGAPYQGRFAPSPTGPLHAGSLVAALASWIDARAHGGRWLVRIEDVDTRRCVPGADQIILEQLAACGLVPDEPPVYQSQRSVWYQKALDDLVKGCMAYPCGCTRQSIAKALAASGQSRQRHGELVYPGTCRQGLNGQPARAWRFRTVDIEQNMPFAHIARASTAIDLIVNQISDGVEAQVLWHDCHLGPQSQNVSRDVGDFVLKRADGLWAYQLAVVVDDAAQGITHVVRGADLTDNTARQILLQRALHLPTPHYLHTPLVRGADGEKLSKQNDALALDLHDPLLALNQAAQVLGLTEHTGLTGDALAAWVNAWRDTMPPEGQPVASSANPLAFQADPAGS